jgi:hypothetical protein
MLDRASPLRRDVEIFGWHFCLVAAVARRPHVVVTAAGNAIESADGVFCSELETMSANVNENAVAASHANAAVTVISNAKVNETLSVNENANASESAAFLFKSKATANGLCCRKPPWENTLACQGYAFILSHLRLLTIQKPCSGIKSLLSLSTRESRQRRPKPKVLTRACLGFLLASSFEEICGQNDHFGQTGRY